MAKPRKRAPARWALQDAKNKFSRVVDAAVRGQPQIVTRRGVETAVVISREAYEQLTGARETTRPSLAQYILDVPRAAVGGTFDRITMRPRKLSG